MLDIIKVGNKVLREIAEGVDLSTEKEYISHLVEEMIETVKATGGVGLAAPQVGISKRLIIVRDSDTNEFIPMINPIITWTSFDRECMKEGCLSVVDENNKPIHKNIFRFTRVKVKYIDIEGKEQEKLVKNHLMSRIIQHEIDHLQGRLFIDYINTTDK